ncbi:hypothetical protein G4B88_006731 [Cannabis sativa]|uniref:Uncharacterized protein n=1 Tax=Cannabis sativa TaxID=3483 RepID=A0A7J6GU95_CANSA|nr:hypothetical protein G4B88_006731 [Cannabis sativa]
MKTRFDYPKSGFDSPKSSYSQTTTTKALRLPAMARAIADSLSRRSFLIISSMLYFVSGISLHWLVSKGQMIEVKKVLQRLRGIEDVAGEMTLLVKGLGVGSDTSIEEYIIGSANELTDKDQIKLYGPDQGRSWIAKPVTGQSALGLVSRHGSMANQSGFVDPLVTL